MITHRLVKDGAFFMIESAAAYVCTHKRVSIISGETLPELVSWIKYQESYAPVKRV